jgi:UDP-glucose 4-epimerase
VRTIERVRAIVTGGAGFIGSHLAEALLARGDEVLVIDNLSRGKREQVPGGAELVERDVREPLGDDFASFRPDVCFHLAAQADVRVSVARPAEDAEVNVLGSVQVLAAASEHDTKVVFSSTGGAIYGECSRPAREDDALEPVSPYGAAKLAAETYLQTWNRLHGSSHTALRYANVYGPRQESGLEGGVVAIFLERMSRGEPTTIYGDGSQTRDFVHVADIVAATLAAIETGGIFNIGSGVETSVLELHDLCRRVAGADVEPELAPERLGEIRRSVLDPSLAERELGWTPALSLAEGLRETWEWYSN